MLQAGEIDFGQSSPLRGYPGATTESPLHRESPVALARKSAHARLDALEHAPAPETPGRGSMTSKHTVARRLAAAIASGRLTEREVMTRASRALGRSWRWLGPFVRRIVEHFGTGTRPLRFCLERFILADEGFLKACRKQTMAVTPELRSPPRMAPAPGPPQEWGVPEFQTPHELALRLNLTPGELAWFADVRGLEAKVPPGPLRHYVYRWRRKKHGWPRLIESPKQRLKAIQRWILSGILEQIPPHPAAHGFRSGRSIVTFVAPHVGRRVVLRTRNRMRCATRLRMR